MKSWLAQGSSGRRVTLLPGTTFLHINGALETGIKSISPALSLHGVVTSHYVSRTKNK